MKKKALINAFTKGIESGAAIVWANCKPVKEKENNKKAVIKKRAASPSQPQAE